MKKVVTFLFVLTMVLVISVKSHAALELRGTDSLGNRLIYDNALDITWYDYTRSTNTWQNQVNWASGLSVDFGGTVFDDWRLTSTLNQNGSGPCTGYNCTGSEMGHLYYTELGNTAGGGLTNTDDFQRLASGAYWSGTGQSAPAPNAWTFSTGDGYQRNFYKGMYFYAVAVRTGDVSVAVAPEPVSMVLFGAGGVVLGARRMVIRRRG